MVKVASTFQIEIISNVVSFYVCRDQEEPLKEMTETEKKDLETEEDKRLNKDSVFTVSPPKPAKEKGLRIYFSTE